MYFIQIYLIYNNYQLIANVVSLVYTVNQKKGVQKNKHIKLIYSNIINIYNLYIHDAVKY